MKDLCFGRICSNETTNLIDKLSYLVKIFTNK